MSTGPTVVAFTSEGVPSTKAAQPDFRHTIGTGSLIVARHLGKFLNQHYGRKAKEATYDTVCIVEVGREVLQGVVPDAVFAATGHTSAHSSALANYAEKTGNYVLRGIAPRFRRIGRGLYEILLR